MTPSSFLTINDWLWEFDDLVPGIEIVVRLLVMLLSLAQGIVVHVSIWCQTVNLLDCWRIFSRNEFWPLFFFLFCQLIFRRENYNGLFTRNVGKFCNWLSQNLWYRNLVDFLSEKQKIFIGNSGNIYHLISVQAKSVTISSFFRLLAIYHLFPINISCKRM